MKSIPNLLLRLASLVVILASVFSMTPGFGLEALTYAFNDYDYPTYTLDLTTIKGPGPIPVSLARNENYLLLFQVYKPLELPLAVEIEDEPGTRAMECQVWQLRAVPDDLPANFIPDGMVPLEKELIRQETPFRVAVNIRTLPSAPPGNHNLGLLFRCGDSMVRVPVKVRLWKFELPADLPITTFATFRTNRDWFQRYGVVSDEAYGEVLRSYLSALRAYKFNAVSEFYPLPVVQIGQGRALAEYPEFLEMLRFVVQDQKFRYFHIPYLPGAPMLAEEGNQFAQLALKYYPAFVEYLQNQGWLDKALVKIWDEPRPYEYDKAAQAYGLIKWIAPQLRTESSGGVPDPELVKVVDVWACCNTVFDQVKLETLRYLGQNLWFYFNRLHGSDQPPAHQRLIGWYMFRYGFNGYLLWGVNYWVDDPWTVPPGEGDFYRRGTFFYPHPLTGKPLPTLRLESLRRGWEDFQYFWMLAEMFRQGKVPVDSFQRIQQKLETLTENLHEASPLANWKEMEDLRLEMGNLLNQAHQSRIQPALFLLLTRGQHRFPQ